jgi:hypothetical protein
VPHLSGRVPTIPELLEHTHERYDTIQGTSSVSPPRFSFCLCPFPCAFSLCLFLVPFPCALFQHQRQLRPFQSSVIQRFVHHLPSCRLHRLQYPRSARPTTNLLAERPTFETSLGASATAARLRGGLLQSKKQIPKRPGDCRAGGVSEIQQPISL